MGLFNRLRGKNNQANEDNSANGDTTGWEDVAAMANKTNSGEIGWDDVASMAGKMNTGAGEKSSQETSREVHQGSEATEAIRQELESISRQIDYLEQQMAPLQRRRAEADSKLNGGGEEFKEKSYSWGNGDAVEDGGSYSFDDYMRDTKGIGPKLTELREQKEELENRRRELLEKIEDINRSKQLNSSESLGSQKREISFEERINDFAERVDRNSLTRFMQQESFDVRDKLRKLKAVEARVADRNGERSFLDKKFDDRDRRDYLQFLRRHGYTTSEQNSSSVFKQLSENDPYSELGESELRRTGEQRAKDWKTIDIVMHGKNRGAFKKEIGLLTKIPERWDDKEFTSHEIHELAQIAKLYTKEN